MKTVVEHCPLCGGGKHSFFERCDGNVVFHLCATCGMVFQTPRMSEEALTDFYHAQYRLLVQGQEEPSEKDRRVQAGRARNLVAFTRRYVGRISVHLDIGCSAGLLMSAFQQDYGCQSWGIEPGDAYRAYAREKGLQVEASLYDLDPELKQSFDLISMSHLLEHLTDSTAYLQRIKREWLTPDGHLLVEVPNIYGHTALELAHLAGYSAHTLHLTLEKGGFSVRSLKAHGMPRSKLIPLYVTALASAQPTRIQRSELRLGTWNVRARRKLGMAWRRSATRLLPSLAWLPFPALDEF